MLSRVVLLSNSSCQTTIVAKLQKKGGGAPVREAAVDEQTQKEMMAFAYKKQQEWKVVIPLT